MVPCSWYIHDLLLCLDVGCAECEICKTSRWLCTSKSTSTCLQLHQYIKVSLHAGSSTSDVSAGYYFVGNDSECEGAKKYMMHCEVPSIT